MKTCFLFVKTCMKSGLQQKQADLQVFGLRFQVKSLTLGPSTREELTPDEKDQRPEKPI